MDGLLLDSRIIWLEVGDDSSTLTTPSRIKVLDVTAMILGRGTAMTYACNKPHVVLELWNMPAREEEKNKDIRREHNPCQKNRHPCKGREAKQQIRRWRTQRPGRWTWRAPFQLWLCASGHMQHLLSHCLMRQPHAETLPRSAGQLAPLPRRAASQIAAPLPGIPPCFPHVQLVHSTGIVLSPA